MKHSISPDTLAFPTPAWCVGSYDTDGKANVMTIAWGGICCSKPPCVTISLRKATYSFGSIMERKAYTINIPSAEHVAATDYFGMASGKNTDKFADTGLTPSRSQVVDAPYVDEFPLILECQVIHTLEIGLHTQFVGEIKGILAEESILGQDGKLKPMAASPFAFMPGSREYVALGESLGKGFSLGKSFKQ